jgi:hypothetical protein
MSQDNFDPGYPVLIYQEGMSLPKEGTYFVVSGNGLWMHKDTGIVSCFVKVDNISFLPDLNASTEVNCRLPKIPARLVWRIKNFFRAVVQKHHAEAEVNLYFSKIKGEFRVHIPEQVVSTGSVNYKRIAATHMPGMEDFLRVGTIHSHCDFGAFHSGTDVGDEEDFDGLHCTFGHNDKDEFTISASVVVNGFRSKIDPSTVLEGVNNTTQDRYTLDAIDEATALTWSEDLEEWLANVRGHDRPIKQPPFQKDDQIEWAGDLNTVQIKTVCGEGPFKVLSCQDGKVVISTKAGKARFSNKLFKKVEK